jgi:hypothetical protein
MFLVSQVKTKTKKRLAIYILLNCLVISCSLAVSPSATAQFQQYGSNNQQSKAPVATPIKDKISLPDIPDYPGRIKLISGNSYPAGADGGGPSYSLSYLIADPANQVSDWYVNALKSGGWNVKTSSTTGAITATNEKGTMCVISVESNGNAGGCSANISYSMSSSN